MSVAIEYWKAEAQRDKSYFAALELIVRAAGFNGLVWQSDASGGPWEPPEIQMPGERPKFSKQFVLLGRPDEANGVVLDAGPHGFPKPA